MKSLALAIIFGFFGMLLAAGLHPIIGLVSGALLGWVIGELLGSRDAEKITLLQEQLVKMRRRVEKLEQARPGSQRAGYTPPPKSDAPPSHVPQTAAAAVKPAPKPPIRSAPSSASSPPSPAPVQPRKASMWSWIITGNVPVKVGVLVLFFGTTFGLMLAIERGWIRFPIELRLLGVALAAAGMFAFGWRLRDRLRGYALTLLGGAVGILYLDVFIAYRIYELVPAGFAFVAFVAVTAVIGTLAVRENAMVLAVFGIMGGFLAPVLASSGSGNHVALFSYYLVLNAAIVGIALFKAWRPLNVLGFVFTWIIGWSWAAQYYEPELMASVLPFVAAFFLMFVGISVLYAFRRTTELTDYLDVTLVFGTPVVSFATLWAIVHESAYGMAIGAAGAALVYILIAVMLERRKASEPRLLIEAFTALGIGFATLAIPLAVDGRWTSAAWALEATALIWVGIRQSRLLARVAGCVLHFAAGCAFFFVDLGRSIDPIPFLNADCLGTLLVALSALFAGLCLDRQRDRVSLVFALLGGLWGGLWWFGGGSREIALHVEPAGVTLAAISVFWAASVALGVRLARVLSWRALAWPLYGLVPALAVVLLVGLLIREHPLADGGWIAWPLALVALYSSLRDSEPILERVSSWIHAPALWLLAALATLELVWQIDRVGGSHVWQFATVVAMLGCAVIAIVRAPLPWPVAQHRGIYRTWGIAPLVVGLTLAVLVMNATRADPDPLPYIPLLNPLDAAGGFTLLVLSICLPGLIGGTHTVDKPGRRRGALALAILGLSTATLVRTVHHWGGIPFEFGALMGSVVLHASLSLFWGGLGLGAMILGARRALRPVWFSGASLMGIVVLKLFLVDLGNSGTLARVVSFVGAGLLLIVVGYFAGVPPRDS